MDTTIQDNEQSYFTVEQAEGMIPQVQTKLFCIFQIHRLINSTLDQLSAMGLTYKPDLLKTMAPDEDMAAIDLLSTLKISLTAMKKEIKLLEMLGCSLEDIDTGRVTWPALLNGQKAQLAWSNGDRHIETSATMD
jgi:hypothetical protein